MKNRNSKINILFIEHSGSIMGGGQFSVLGLITNLREIGYSINITVPQRGDFFDLLEERGFAPILFKINTFKGGGFIKLPGAVSQLRRILSSTHTQIAHVNSSRAALVTGLACIGKRIPMIWHLRAPGRELLYDIFLAWLSSRIIAISHFTSKRIKWFKHKVIVVHNGVEIPPFPAQNEAITLRRRLFPDNCSIVGIACQLTPWKGIDIFIKAGSIVLKTIPNIHFLIVGEEPLDRKGYKSYLKKICVKLNMQGNVVFAGFQKNINSYYALMDVFAFFSQGEPFGRVVVEAMMAGLPVVSHDIGAIPEIVENGISGYLIDHNNIEKGAEKLIFLLNSDRQRRSMGQKGKERAEKLFSARLNAEKVDSVYRDLLSGAKC